MKTRMWVATLALSLSCAPIASAQSEQIPTRTKRPHSSKSHDESPPESSTNAWLGVQLAADEGGPRIAEVIRGTAAAAAGLRVGDYILRVGHRPVRLPTDVTTQVRRMAVGDRIRLQIRRKHGVFDATLRLTGTVSPAELLHRRLVGEQAPDFDLPVVHGSDATRLTMSRFRGQVVVLEFWATWCQNCGDVHRRLNRALAESEDTKDRFAVLSMAAESPNQIDGYVQRHKFSYPVLFDRYAEVRARYHAPSLPTLVVIDQTGVIRFAKAGAGETTEAAIAVARRLAANSSLR